MLLALVAPPGRGTLVWFCGVLISAGAGSYILYTASEEPFFFMSPWTLVTLEGLGLMFAVLLGIWAKAALAAARRIAAAKLRIPLSAMTIAWTLLCTCYLLISMLGCLEDYRRFRTGQPGTLGSINTLPSAGQ